MKYDHISLCGPLCKMFILASASLSKVNFISKRYLKSSTCTYANAPFSMGLDLCEGEDFLIYIAFLCHLFV